MDDISTTKKKRVISIIWHKLSVEAENKVLRQLLEEKGIKLEFQIPGEQCINSYSQKQKSFLISIN